MEILFATDGTRSSEAAAGLIVAACERLSHSIRVVSVWVPEAYSPAPWTVVLGREELAGRAVEQSRTRLGKAGFSVTGEVIGGVPGNEIIREAQVGGFDLLVVGWDGAAADLAGPVCAYVMAHAPCPVLVVREEPAHRPVRVLMAIDGSEPSKAAAATASRLLSPDLVLVRAVTVAEARQQVEVPALAQHGPTPMLDAGSSAADIALDLRVRGFVAEGLTRYGEAAEELIRELDEGVVDMAGVGATRGGSDSYRVLGRVAAALVHRAPAALIARDPLV